MTLNGSAVLRLLALVCFVLAAFGVGGFVGLSFVPLGLAFWVGSTFV